MVIHGGYISSFFNLFHFNNVFFSPDNEMETDDASESDLDFSNVEGQNTSLSNLNPGKYIIIDSKKQKTQYGRKFLVNLQGKEDWYYLPKSFWDESRKYSAKFRTIGTGKGNLYLVYRGMKKYRNRDGTLGDKYDVEVLNERELKQRKILL